MSIKGNNISQITDYLKGKLDARAMYELERSAQDDPFLMDALDGFEAIGNDQSTNLDELKTRLADRVAEKKDRNILLWRILPIAACLLLLIGSYWLFDIPSKQQHIDNIAHVKRPAPATENATKPSAPASIKKTADSGKYLAKNHPTNIVSSPKTENKYADTNNNIASNNNRVTKPFAAGDLALAIKNLPKDVIEKAQVKDDYAYQSSSIHRNRVFGNLGNAHLKQNKDTSAGRFLNTDLLSVNSSKSPRNTATEFNDATLDKSLPAPVIRGYVKINKPKNDSYIITGKEVQDNPVGNVEQLLQGKVAGLNIQNNKGAPGMRGSVNIRGLSGIPGASIRLISGKITDTAGVPLAGVSVHGANGGITTTDANGRYRILVNKDSAVVVSGIGYKTQSLQIKPEQSTLDVKLKEGSQALAEVSISGYVKHMRNQTTGALYIITGKNGKCKENLRFKKRFFAKITIAERYVTEHADGNSATTVRDGKFLRALKFIAKRAPTTITADKTAYGYADLKVFAQNKERWLHWYELNKCNNLK